MSTKSGVTTQKMSAIKNEAKIKNPLIVAIREQLEHRALWMYFLCDEAKKKGMDSDDYAPEAIRRCGLYQGTDLRTKAEGGDSLKGLRRVHFSKFAQWAFEMDIKYCSDDNLDIDVHYCPLVKAWQKQDCSDEEIAILCDHAMCGDRGIAASFGCELELLTTIAKGNNMCRIRYVRKNESKERTDEHIQLDEKEQPDEKVKKNEQEQPDEKVKKNEQEQPDEKVKKNEQEQSDKQAKKDEQEQSDEPIQTEELRFVNED